MEILSRLYPYGIAISWIFLYAAAAYGMVLFMQYALWNLKEQWEELQAFLKEHRMLVKRMRRAKRRARQKALEEKKKLREVNNEINS